jgi:hypothetical protein
MGSHSDQYMCCFVCLAFNLFLWLIMLYPYTLVYLVDV